jgi:hypothetical protein
MPNTIEIWSELDHRIIHDSQGAVKKAVNVDAVKSSILNILGTRRGERVMLPTFATALYDMVFEPINEELLDFIAREVKDNIEIWDNRVSVVGVDYYANHDLSEITLTINFMLRGYTQTFAVEVPV